MKQELNKGINYFQQLNGIKLKNYFFGIVLISLTILFIGYLHSIATVKIPDKRFNKNNYSTAKNYFKGNKNFIEINTKYIEDKIIQVIQKNEGFDYLIATIKNDLKNKMVIIQKNEKIEIEPSIIIDIKNTIKTIDKELDIVTNDYNFDGKKYNKLMKMKNKLMKFKNFRNIKIIPIAEYAKSRYCSTIKEDHFSFVAGKFANIALEDSVFTFYGKPFKPVISKGFLKRNNLYNKENSLLLNNNKVLNNKIINNAKAEHNSNLKIKKRQINSERSLIRREFYAKWFATFLTIIITFIMFRIQLRYYLLIRRKDLKKKTSYDVYFATNISSKIFRLIALLIVFIGIAELLINAIISVISGNMISLLKLPILDRFYNIIDILHPIATTISVIIASWFFVLISESICFITNLYHIAFIKTYGDLNEKK